MATAQKTSARDFLPDRINLSSLRIAAQTCRGCDLYKNATQTVFGSGKRKARVMLVGEVPGDEEDRAGEPFVGPAGRLLRAAMAEAGLSEDDAYLTNAVKHFRWEPRGKRRLHKKPSSRQIEACKPWLQVEILVIKPPVVVALGATAAQALMGRDFRLTRHRGEFIEREEGQMFLATYHPSAVLRAPDEADRRQKRREFVDDLRLVAERIARRRRETRASRHAR
jgi:uracil-DNA glycosylase